MAQSPVYVPNPHRSAGNDVNPLPPMLGMDFISNFRLTVARRDDRVDLEPAF